MGSAKQSEQEPKRRYDFPCFIRPTITPAPWKSHRQHLGRTADVYKSACKYACLPLLWVFTHVTGSYANLLQQKKVWISLGYWETAQPPHP